MTFSLMKWLETLLANVSASFPKQQYRTPSSTISWSHSYKSCRPSRIIVCTESPVGFSPLSLAWRMGATVASDFWACCHSKVTESCWARDEMRTLTGFRVVVASFWTGRGSGRSPGASKCSCVVPELSLSIYSLWLVLPHWVQGCRESTSALSCYASSHALCFISN